LPGYRGLGSGALVFGQSSTLPLAMNGLPLASSETKRIMSPEWIPLLFVAAVIVLLLLMMRPRAQSRRVTICRIVVMEAIYLGTAYLLLDVLEHPPAEAFLGSLIVAALAGAIPSRFYRKLAGEK
jgi:hypothetical protein